MVNFSVVRETSHRGDCFLGKIVVSGCIVPDNLQSKKFIIFTSGTYTELKWKILDVETMPVKSEGRQRYQQNLIRQISTSFPIHHLLAQVTTKTRCRNYLSVLRMNTLSYLVDFLIHLRSVMVTLLASSSYSKLHTRRMPSTNAGNLSQTLVCLSRQFLSVPSGCYTCNKKLLLSRTRTQELI